MDYWKQWWTCRFRPEKARLKFLSWTKQSSYRKTCVALELKWFGLFLQRREWSVRTCYDF